VLLIVIGLLRYRAWRRLRREQAETRRQKEEAERHRLEAEKQRAEAALKKAEAQVQAAEALRQRREAETQRAQADLQAREAKIAKAEAAAAKAELNRFKDAMVGVRAVISSHTPLALSKRADGGKADAGGSTSGDANAMDLSDGSDVAGGGDAVAAKPTGAPDQPPAAPAKPKQRVPYYWHEDPGRVSAHNPNDVITRDGESWVRYAWSVCAQLEDAYEEHQAAAAALQPVPRLVIDLCNQISSTGTEKKAFATETGTVFTFDLSSMSQSNAKTGFQRKILRVAPSSPPAASPLLDGGDSTAAAAGPRSAGLSALQSRALRGG